MKNYRGKDKNPGGKNGLIIPKVIRILLATPHKALPFLVSLSLLGLQGGFVTNAEAGMAHNKQQLLRDCSHGMQELFTWHHKHYSVCLQMFLQRQKVLHSGE